MPSIKRTIQILSLAAFVSIAAMRISDTILPQIAFEFQTTAGKASKMVSYFAIMYGICQFFFGPLADKYGKLRIISLALLLSALTNLGVALSSSIETIILYRALSGGSTAGIVVLAMAWIGEKVEYSERQQTLAHLLFGTLSGATGGQILGGFCAENLDWRYGFVVICFLYLVCWAMLRKKALADEKSQTSNPEDIKTWARFAGVLRIRWARFILVIVGFEGIVLYGALAFIPTYLHIKMGISLTAAGGIMAAFGVGGIVYAAFAKKLLNKLGEGGLVKGGGIILGLSFLILIIADNWVAAVVDLFFLGLGQYMLHNTLQTNATQMAPQSRGTAMALFACLLFFGQFIGVTIAALFVDSSDLEAFFTISAISLPVIGFIFFAGLKRASAHSVP